MTLLLDEMLSPKAAAQLRADGHDVVAVSEHPGYRPRLSDEAVQTLALTDRRAIVTDNVRDFRPLHAAVLASGRRSCGMVYLRGGYPRSNDAIGVVVSALAIKLQRFPTVDGLARAGGETWLD